MAKKGIHRSTETEFKKGRRPSGSPFKNGRIPWNKGLKGVCQHSPETIEKLRQAHTGKRYDGGEHWVIKICQKCGKEFEVKKGEGKNRLYCSRECAYLNRKSKGFIRLDGYRVVRQDCKSILEHRLIIEQILGRPLKKSELVHHINGNKLDNRLENLMIMSQASHWGLVHYLANLWVRENPDIVNKVTRDFEQSFRLRG